MTQISDAAMMVRCGRALGAQLVAGDWLALVGELGAGKTTLTQGIAAGMGIADPVLSPTFVLSRHHRNPSGVDLVHCDAYRLPSPEAFADLEVDDPNAAVLVEWGRDAVAAMTDSYLVVNIEPTASGRLLTATGVGDSWPEGRLLRIREEWERVGAEAEEAT